MGTACSFVRNTTVSMQKETSNKEEVLSGCKKKRKKAHTFFLFFFTHFHGLKKVCAGSPQTNKKKKHGSWVKKMSCVIT